MTDFYRMAETKLDRAVDDAIARENARWLAQNGGRMTRFDRQPITLEVRDLQGDYGTLYLDDVCDACKGAGVVPSELWARWLRRFEHEETRLEAAVRATEAKTGLREMTRAELVDAATAYAGPEPDEPEELECDACSGRGMVPTGVGKTILDFVRRYS